MNGQPGDRFRVPKSAPVVLTGGRAADREELGRRLEAAGLSIPIETVAEAAAVAGGEPAPVGVVRLTTPGDDDRSGIASDSGASTPSILVGPGVDVAAAYEAGVSQVIPLAVDDLPAAAIDRMVACLRRGRSGQVAAALLDRAPVGVTLHNPETGEVVAHNNRCRTLLGFDADEPDLAALAARCGVARSELVDAVDRAAAGTETTLELHDLADGATADSLDGRFELLTVGGERFVVGWLVDVSERAEREREVRRYETILESLGDAVYAIDSEGTIEYVNQRYVSMKGVDREKLLGSSIYDWVSEETEGRTKEQRRQLQEGKREIGTVEYEFQSVDGTVTPAEIRFVEIPSGDQAVGGAGVIRDISDRKSYERRLERQNDRLEEFASVVSHDLRNPLSVASGRLDLAMDECDSDHLDAVADAHDRMGELIDDLLTLAREGDGVRELEPVALASLVERCWTSVETEDAAIDVAVDRELRADPGRLRQLVENLLRNAVEHGGDDVTITVGLLDDDTGFYVADDGPGIPPERREAVFEVGHSTDPEGTGFGLGIVTQVAEAHGWTVRLTDAAGGGARFEFAGVEFVSE